MTSRSKPLFKLSDEWDRGEMAHAISIVFGLKPGPELYAFCEHLHANFRRGAPIKDAIKIRLVMEVNKLRGWMLDAKPINNVWTVEGTENVASQ